MKPALAPHIYMQNLHTSTGLKHYIDVHGEGTVQINKKTKGRHRTLEPRGYSYFLQDSLTLRATLLTTGDIGDFQ